MMNFRFHLVSLVAVFLSLAVGIVIGSTVVDRAIVENLRDRIDDVEARADATHAENRQLQTDLDELRGFVAEAAPFAVAGRLTAVPVVVVAERAASTQTVEDTVVRLRQAGASVPVVVWLEGAWTLDDPGSRTELRRIVGRLGSVDEVRAEGIELLGTRLAGVVATDDEPTHADGGSDTDAGDDADAGRHADADADAEEGRDAGAGPDEGSPGDAPAGAAAGPDVLDALRTAGFVSVEAVGDVDVEALGGWPPPDLRALVIAAPEPEPDTRDEGDGPEPVQPAVAAGLVVALDAAGVPTLFGEAHEERDGGPERGAALATVLGDDTLRTRIATVDALDTDRGRVASVLALEDLGRRTVGHYGTGPGAGRALPSWAGP